MFPNKEFLHVAKASVVENYSHIKGTKVLYWSVYYKKRTDECTILMNTYYFTIPESPYDQTIVTHRAIMEELPNIYENNFSMYAGFWADNFLENNELTEQSFGFSVTNHEDADNLLVKFQYLEKALFFKVISGSVSEINEEKLFGLIKDYNKNGQDDMTEL